MSAAQIFSDLVCWCRDLTLKEKAPGYIVGLSGTDSIAAFLICYEALKSVGKADRLVGVHYGKGLGDKTPEQIERLVEMSPNYRWFTRTIIPWLQDQAPLATLVIDESDEITDDYHRWADLMRRSLNGSDKRSKMADGNFWVVGTRNRTEEMLGTFSNISGCASLQPLLRLWKSDVLSICKHLGVPGVAIEHARQADCDCGRYDLAAAHIEEIDAILAGANPAVSDAIREKLHTFIAEQTAEAAFKKRIPYSP